MLLCKNRRLFAVASDNSHVLTPIHVHLIPIPIPFPSHGWSYSHSRGNLTGSQPSPFPCTPLNFTPPRQTWQNCFVCVASASAVWMGFPPRRHNTDRTVLSGLACRCELHGIAVMWYCEMWWQNVGLPCTTWRHSRQLERDTESCMIFSADTLHLVNHVMLNTVSWRQYIVWSDVTESFVTIRSPFCAYIG